MGAPLSGIGSQMPDARTPHPSQGESNETDAK